MVRIFGNFFLTIIIVLLALTPMISLAGCCACDPVYERDFHGELISSAYVRDIACMEGSNILTTVSEGWVVQIIAETDGWYKVSLADGTKGWVGARLVQLTDKSLNDHSGPCKSCATQSSETLEKYLGYIFLAVEKNGEAYYYYPDDKNAYYLGRPSDAFKIMRDLGLGAKHDFINSNAYFPEHVLGKILLDVEENGEAYYIYPQDRKKYYLGRPDDAYKIMRDLGLGINNNDLSLLKITIN